MVRVLVADDSPLFATAITELMDGEPSMLVVGVASNGREAVDMTEQLRPDLLIMDIHMPVMDGLLAIEEIMARRPTPILVMTSDPNVGDSHYEALRRGALDLLPKPTQFGGGPHRALVLERIRLLATVPVVRHPYGNRRLWRSPSDPSNPRVPLTARAPSPAPAPSPSPAASRSPLTPALTGPFVATRPYEQHVVAIAASTGGPAALAQIVEGLPARFPGALLVVQHITPGFMPSLMGWLQRVTRLKVRLGTDGGAIETGTITFAPDDRHMTVDATTGCLCVEHSPPIRGHRPSASRLLASVAEACGSRAVGVILSGMGDDGVSGLAAIRSAGGLTIAQDESTSVVFGMPAEACRTGAATRVLPLDHIAESLCAHLGWFGS